MIFSRKQEKQRWAWMTRPARFEAKPKRTEETRLIAGLLPLGQVCTRRADALNVLEQVTQATVRYTDAAAGYALLLAPDAPLLHCEVAVSTGDVGEIPKTCPSEEGFAAKVLAAEAPVLVQHGRSAHSKKSAFALDQMGSSVCGLPLRAINSAGETVVAGVLILTHILPNRQFTEAEADICAVLTGIAATAFAGAALFEEKRKTVQSALQEICRRAVERDISTQGHAHRVAEVCIRLARKLNLDPETTETLWNAAHLHELGKIGIPDAILHKPMRLTDEELHTLRQYPQIGCDLCAPLGMSEETLFLIRNHAERLDGTGYPDHLNMSQIPTPLRILAIADAFDAMSSRRSYRPDMGKRERNEQLNRFAGSQFDPSIVEMLKTLWNEGELDDLYSETTPEITGTFDPQFDALETIADQAA